MKQLNFIFLIALLSTTICSVTYASEEKDDCMACPSRKASSPIPPAPGFKRSHKTFNFGENSAFQSPPPHKNFTVSPVKNITIAASKLKPLHPHDCKKSYSYDTNNKEWLNPKLQSNSRPPLANQFNKKTESYNSTPELESQDC